MKEYRFTFPANQRIVFEGIAMRALYYWERSPLPFLIERSIIRVFLYSVVQNKGISLNLLDRKINKKAEYSKKDTSAKERGTSSAPRKERRRLKLRN